MKKKATKVLSILLCLVLTLTTLPGFAFTAFAAGEEARWGASADSLTHSGTFAEAVAAVNADGSTVGCIQLQNDVTSETGFEITRGSVTLDLNGKTIDVTGNYPNALGFSGTELIIQDSGTGGTIRHSHRLGLTGLNIAGGTVELKSGTLDAHEAVCIYGDDSSFTQSGGAVNGRITVIGGSCTLSGGTFSGNFIWHSGRLILEKPAGAERYRLTAMQTMPVSAVTLPDGWKLADKNESEFTGEAVEPAGYVYVTACPASVTTSGNETTYYLHLDEAVEAARDHYGSTVKLLRDVESYHPIHIANASFTLDLNGKLVTSDHSIFEILTYSFITLTDSSAEQSGRMTVNSQSESAILLYEAVQLTIKGGTVETRGSYAVDMSNEGRSTDSWLIMEGGTLIGGHAAINASGDRVIINGGTLEHTRDTGVDIHYSHGELELLYHEDPEGISVLNGSSADIKTPYTFPGFVFYDEGGNRVRTLTSGKTYTIGRGIPLCDYEHDWRNRDGVCWRCEFICTPHDFNAEYVCKICGYAYPVVITSADGAKTYYPDLPAAIEAASALPGSTVTPREDITLGDAVDISGGAFTIDLAGRMIECSGAVFDITGDSEIVITDSSAEKNGRVLGSSGSIPILVCGTASLTVSGSTIEGGLSTYDGSPTVIITHDAEIISRSTALTVDGGSVIIEDGSIECTAYNDICVISGSLDLSGLWPASGVTLRNGGDAIDASDIKLPDEFAFYDGNQEADTLNYADPYTTVYTIRQKNLNPCSEGEHDWKNRDGVCSKCQNAHNHLEGEGDPYTCIECKYIFPAAVTSGDSTTVYKTLDNALSAAILAEGSTLSLRDDVPEDRGYEIAGGRFTIDLCGKTVIGSWILENDADVIIKDSSSERSGKLKSTEIHYPAVVLMDSASLTVEGGTIEAHSNTAIDMPDGGNGNKSTLVMTGGKLVGLIKAGGDSVTLSGGSIESETVSIRYRSGTLDLTGHPDPVGITVQNESGEEVYVSGSGILAEGYVFFNAAGNPIRILEDRTLYTIQSLPVGIYVGEAELKDGQYLANGSSVPTDTQPEGGYAYFKDGVLTLHDYVYSGNGSKYADIDGTYSTTIGSWNSLVINVEGTSSLTNLSDDSDAVTVGNGDLTIIGAGTLHVSATYGFYVYAGDVTVKGSTLNIETGLDGIYSGNDTVIEDGTVNINTGDIGVNASKNIVISGGKVSIESDGDGIYAYTGNVVINGGAVETDAAVDGIYAYEGNVTIEGGRTDVMAGDHGIDGVSISIGGTDTVVTAKGSTAVSAYESLTLDEDNLGIVLPENGTAGEKTVLDASGNTARAAYIGKKELTEHAYNWHNEYDFDVRYHYIHCQDAACPLLDDMRFSELNTEEHNFDDNNICTVCGLNLWSEYDIAVAGAGLVSGEYLDNDGNVTATKPEGGYAYFKDGVLTLSDYAYSGEGYGYGDGFSALILFDGDLEITLEGTNALTNEAVKGEGISTENGSLAIGGSGALSVSAACGIYLSGGGATFRSGTLTIDAGEVAVFTRGGDVTLGGAAVTAKAGYAGILAENGSVRIEDGTVSITADVSSIDSFGGAVWVKPADRRRIAVYNASNTDGEAVDGSPFTSETDITGLIYGGSFYSIASRSPSYRPSSSGTGSSTTHYTIAFETNGGSEIASETVARDSMLAEPTAPAREGYTFDGWYTDEELTTLYDFDKAVTKNLTLYAKWVAGDDAHIVPSERENPFTDVKPDDWYYEDVMYAYTEGLMKGVTNTTFAPNEKLTRAMLVTVLYRLEGEPSVGDDAHIVPPFADVDMGAYYANAVIWAKQNGIIKGYSETEFAPDQSITREQVAAIFHRYAQVKGIDVSVGENTNILSYTDFDSISEYAVISMQYAVGSGILRGKSASTLGPKDNATRAEIAAILHRFIEANK